LKKCLWAILFLPSLCAHAASTAWVTDKLEVQLRSGSGSQYKVVKSLPSGTELTVVEGGEANGFSHVTLESGEEGWVSNRYLSSTPVASADREENAKKLAALREDNQKLKAELAASKSSKDAAEKSIQDINAESARLNSEVTAIRQASANVLKIQNERDQLTQEKVSLESELETLKREKQAMDASSKQDWFMIGAGVLFGGIVLGLILPRISWRKKSNWDSF
jgi:SH3 domain protein